MQLVIGNRNYSTWSLRPWLLLDAHNIEFDEIVISLQQEGFEQRVGQYTDAGKVPVLIDNGHIIWESLAICEYISESRLGGKGWPEKTADRAIARSICAEMHSGFGALRNELPMNCRARRQLEISEAVKADIQRIDLLWSRYARTSANGEPRLFGAFSIADCFYAPVALRFMTYGISLSETADDYAASLLRHPSVQRWVSMAKNETEIIEEDEAGI